MNAYLLSERPLNGLNHRYVGDAGLLNEHHLWLSPTKLLTVRTSGRLLTAITLAHSPDAENRVAGR